MVSGVKATFIALLAFSLCLGMGCGESKEEKEAKAAKAKAKAAAEAKVAAHDKAWREVSDAVEAAAEAKHSQATLKRWAILKQTVSNNQWPHATVIQRNLGKANNVQQKVTMNTRLVVTAGAVIQTARNTEQVPGCIRWDYFDDAQGQRAIHLYFNPQKGQMIGIHWFESGPRKIGIPGASGGDD
jgi:DNA-directed RNA polymerase beta subunit